MSKQFDVYLVKEKDNNYLEFNRDSRATWFHLSDNELSILTKKLESQELSDLRSEIERLKKVVDCAEYTLSRIIGMSTDESGDVFYCCGHSGLGAVVACAKTGIDNIKSHGKDMR